MQVWIAQPLLVVVGVIGALALLAPAAQASALDGEAGSRGRQLLVAATAPFQSVGVQR